jgi:shikimate kinase
MPRTTPPRSVDLPSLIALIGFMGAGKTTVGRILASRLGYEFIDTDDLIVARAGTPIAELFRQKGEAAFRRMESEVLRTLPGRLRTVIAAGGGAPAQESNQHFFRTSAKTFHLRVSMANARGRAQKPGAAVRPLLSQEESAVQQLYDARRSMYETLGHPVETDGLTPDEVAEQIIRLLSDSRESLQQAEGQRSEGAQSREPADTP